MVFTVAPHDSQDVQNWHNLGAAHNQLRYQTLNNYLKDMRQMTEERYKEWLRVLNALYQIYPYVLQSQSPDAQRSWDEQRIALHKFLQNAPVGMAPQAPIIPTTPMMPTNFNNPNNPNNQNNQNNSANQTTGAQLPTAITTTTSQQQGNQQQSGQPTNQQNP
jgi:hypothetical protein